MKLMLKITIRIIAIVLSILAARALHADQQPQAFIWSRHPDAIRGILPEKKVLVLDAQTEEKQMREDGYLPPRERDALFHKLAIETQIAALDEMDKDMLVMTAKFEGAKSVRKHYPMLSEAQAKQLVKEVKNRP
jgi:hypothetical protein